MKSWRKAAFSWPQPRRMRVNIAAFCSCSAADRARASPSQAANPPYRARCVTRSGCRTATAIEHRASLRDAEQREAFEAGGVDDGFEVADERLQRDIFDVRRSGRPFAARVVADQRVVARQLAVEREGAARSGSRKSNSRCVIQFPVLTRGGPLPTPRINQPHAVPRRAKMNLLLETGRRPAFSVGRLIVLELQGLRFRQRLDVRRGEPDRRQSRGRCS